jgi:phosphate transport system permease protein
MMADKKKRGRGDLIFHALTALCAMLVILVMAGIFFELFRMSLPAMNKFGAGFLVSSSWNPVKDDFGAASSIYGTLVSTFIAMLIAVPLSLVIALFLVELARPAVARVVGYAIELLAAIPSIIYGMWGLFVFAPLLSRYVQPLLTKTLGFLPLFQGPPIGIGMMSAGIILALMVLPFTSAVMRDVFRMVPPVLKESAYGMGATTWEATKGVTVRYGLIGLVGASFLGLGRAIGETMAVTFVIGNAHRLAASLFAPGNTIASTLANEFSEATEPLYISSLVALGLVLYLITYLVQVVSQMLLRRMYRAWSVGL